MKPLDRKTLKKFVRLAGDRLTGDWVLLGGTLLHMLEADYRSTTDIDVVGINQQDTGDTLKLMEIAEELELPIESINQAAAYFLLKIKDYQSHLLLLHGGKKARLFRPDTYLFIQLKIGRLNETDLSDCIVYLKTVRNEGDPVDLSAIEKLLSNALKKEPLQSKRERLERLLAAVAKF
jgi:hypothetical protein